MLKVLSSVLLGLMLLTSCSDDDDQAAGVQLFCSNFERIGQASPGFAGGGAEISEALLYFQQLEDSAPAEIEDDISTLTDGLAALVEAFDEFEGVEGEAALEAVQQASDVDLDELSQAADNVEQYTIQNCDDVEPTE